MKERILCIIPARGGSKGVPRKNIKLLNGKPLIQYSIDAGKNSKYIDKVIVSTEDREIAEAAVNCGAEVPFLRPKELATDISPSIDAILHAVKTLKEEDEYVPEYVCILQCTSPLRKAMHIDGAFEKLKSTNMDAVVSICEAEVNPYWSNVFVGDKLTYFSEQGRNITRRQDLPDAYRMNGAIYIVKTEVLLKYKTIEPEKLTGYIMGQMESVDIDTALDFKIAEVIMKEIDNNA